MEQSRRHTFLTTLLRVPHLVLAVNNMDLVDFVQDILSRVPVGADSTVLTLDPSLALPVHRSVSTPTRPAVACSLAHPATSCSSTTGATRCCASSVARHLR